MKGRNAFTAEEIIKIRELLNLKNRSEPVKQVTYRKSLREMKFYISDFDSSGRGFSSKDLDELIRTNRITII